MYDRFEKPVIVYKLQQGHVMLLEKESILTGTYII